MTTTVLRFLAGLLSTLPHITIVRAEHYGPIIHIHRDELADETPSRFDPDEPVTTERWLDDDDLLAFAHYVGHHLGADDDAIGDAAQHAMAQVALEEAAARVEGDDL